MKLVLINPDLDPDPNQDQYVHDPDRLVIIHVDLQLQKIVKNPDHVLVHNPVQEKSLGVGLDLAVVHVKAPDLGLVQNQALEGPDLCLVHVHDHAATIQDLVLVLLNQIGVVVAPESQDQVPAIRPDHVQAQDIQVDHVLDRPGLDQVLGVLDLAPDGPDPVLDGPDLALHGHDRDLYGRNRALDLALAPGLVHIAPDPVLVDPDPVRVVPDPDQIDPGPAQDLDDRVLDHVRVQLDLDHQLLVMKDQVVKDDSIRIRKRKVVRVNRKS